VKYCIVSNNVSQNILDRFVIKRNICDYSSASVSEWWKKRIPTFLDSSFSLDKIDVLNRVARWFVFKPKIPIWVNFGGFCHGKSWSIV
jgi:hypothetical protein